MHSAKNFIHLWYSKYAWGSTSMLFNLILKQVRMSSVI